MNWDKVSAGAVAMLLCAFLCLTFGVPQKFIKEYEVAPPPPKPLWWPAKQVEEIVQRRHNSSQSFVEVSPELALVVEEKPVYVLVCLVVAEDNFGRLYPTRLSGEDREVILRLAEKDVEAGLKELKSRLHCAIVKEMIAQKQNTTREDCRAYYGGIPAADLLFIDFPLARKHGIECQLVQQKLKGCREGDKGWWEAAKLTKDEYAITRWRDMP